MSAQTQSQTDASITNLHGIGPSRAKHCSANTIAELAEMQAQKVYNELAQTGVSPDQVESIVNEARDAVGIDKPARVYTEGPSDAGPGATDNRGVDIPDNAIAGDGGDAVDTSTFTDTEPETTDIDAFVTDDPGRDNDVVGNMLLIGGDGAFDETGGRYGDLSAQEQAQMIAKRLVEFDIDLEDADAVSAMRRGAGKVAVDSFIKQTSSERLPDLVQPFAPEFDAFDDYADAYEDCRERALEWADTLVVFANGDYVGMWIGMAAERGLRIESPDIDD